MQPSGHLRVDPHTPPLQFARRPETDERLLPRQQRPTGPSSRRTGPSGFRTFGQGSDRRPVDEFGMTVDDNLKYPEPYVKSLELGDLGAGEPVKVNVVAGGRKKNSYVLHEKPSKLRDAASTNSLDDNNDRAGNNLTWDPLANSSDEQAIMQIKTYAVQRNTLAR